MKWNYLKKCWPFPIREARRPLRRKSQPAKRRARLCLEELESRTMPSIVTPFTPRFSTNATGDIAIIGNTLETASTVNNAGRTAADVTAAQNGVSGPNGNHVDNNDWNMAYVDVDNDPTTFNSSQATLTVPAGATVLFAGLYWGSVTTTPAQAAARNTVKFSTPASGGYVSLTGTSLGTFNYTSNLPMGSIYQSFADVTSLVQAAGGGTYAVANVQAALRDANGNLPYMGSYAGWSLVVAYSAPGVPERNLTVFDGYAVQQSSDSPLNIPISGFIAPPSGAVNAKVGVVAYEGDLAITGDSMALNSKQLSDAVNPANNFFDSVISNLGAYQTAKNPNYVNQMGFDAKLVQVPSGTIPNGATSATITLSTSGDGYFPGVVTTAIDLYAPNLVDTKSVTDVTSGGSPRAVAPGDVLQYTVNLTNSGLDAAGNVVLTDPIPANTHYVPGSLQIVSGANAGSKTDAAGDDQAEFNAAGNDVVFRLGAGANATSGGTLAINASTTISFEVQVNAGTPANTIVANQATTAFKGVTTGTPFTSTSNIVALTVLGLSTTPNPATVTLGPNPVKLTDTATLAGGSSPGGAITFTLFYNSGSTPVDRETVPVSGNGSYTTPTGFTLPSSGTVIGAYQWDAAYSGDSNNSSVSDNNAANERVTVSAASPTLTTTPGQTVITLGTSTVTLTDTADLSLGYHPTGTITFTLIYNGGTVDMETVAVNDNGSYTTPTGYTLKVNGSSAGTYQWNARYNGDPNNNTASDINDPNEQVTISKAAPTITTTPSPKTVTLGPSPVTLRDTADIEGGSNPSGTITFTLVHNGTTVDTETVEFNGNGMYTTPTGYTLPTSGTVTGTYQWNASYSGDNNDDPASSINDPNERVTVSAGTPAISTIATPTTASTGTTLQDSAALSGDAPTGSITFNLYAPGVDPTVGPVAYTETVTGVNGNGAYSTSVGFVATTLGTWHWVATYNGDGNNNSVSSGALSEPVTVGAAQADLQITKKDGKATAVPGTSDTYTIVVTNTGPGNVTGATVMDTFPAIFTGVTWTATATGGATGFTASGNGNINDTAVTMPVGSTITYLATGTISPDATGTLSNTATVTPPASVTDPNLTNNSTTDTDTLTPQNDISVTKVDNKGGSSIIPSTGMVVPGTSFTYTMTVSNSGPSTATNVSVSDPVPSGLTFFVWTGNGHTNVSGAISDTIASLAPGASVVYTVAATANSSATGTISNAVTVNAANDTNPNNNSATDDIDILTPQNDVSVTKTDNKGGSSITPSTGTVVPGASITYTITVGNSGPSTATNVGVSDTVPTGLSSFVWSGNGHTNVSGAINDIIASLVPGNTVVYTVTAVVSPSATGTLFNTANVSAANDTNPNNNSATVTDNLTPQNDVSVTKTDNKGGSSITSTTGTVVPGTSFTYTITVSNSGPSTATNVAVSDPFPAGIASDIWSGSNGSSGTGTLTDTIASLAPGASVIYTVAALVDPSATAQLVNTVTVTAANDTNAGNNTATDRDNLTPQNDVGVTKVSNTGGSSILGATGFVVAGSSFTYTITVNNSGPSTATNVRVSDSVPTGLSSFVWSGNGHTNVSGAINDTITSLAPGASVVYTVMAMADPAAIGQISNTVTVTAANDTDLSNNSATDTENVQSQPAVTVSKVDNQGGSSITGSTGAVVPGTSFTYTINASNSGLSTATNVSVTDPVPSGLTSFVWTGNGRTNVLGAINDTITTLAPSTSVVYTVTATASPSATGQITNTVTATETGVESVASDTDLLTPQNDVSVTKTDNKGGSSITPSTGTVVPGTGIIYTITVSNIGPSTATNVKVSDPVPTGLTSFVWTGNGNSNVSGDISDTIASLAPGATVVYTVTATVSPAATGTLSNTVVVVEANDTNTTNNTATDSDTLTPQNNVSVTKTDNKGGSSITPSTGTVVPGTGIVYTITVSNSGPSTATNVSVSDPVPTGLTSFVWTGNSNSNVSGAISDTIASLAPGAAVVYTVTAAVDPAATGTLSNTATVSAANDTNTNNNGATVTDNLTPQADLSIVKTNGTTTVAPGANLTYDITVTNNGPSTVTGATVSDVLPAGTTFVSATNGATYNSVINTVNFTAGALASDGTTSFQLTVAISSTLTGTLSNTATVTPPAGVTDPNLNNNGSTATGPLQPQADLQITKTDGNTTAVPGASDTYTIVVTNAGPSFVTGASVMDTFPVVFTGVTWTATATGAATGFTANGSGNINDTVTMPVGSTITYIATGAIDPSATGALTNIATVTPPAGVTDPDISNNSAGDTDTLTPQYDVSVTKVDNKGGSSITPSTGTVVPGTSFTYTITVSSNGPSTAINVSVSDPLPTGLTSFVWSGNGHTNVSGAISDTIASLAPGASVVYTATATVRPSATGTLSNTATVSAANGTNPNNNSATVTDNLTPQADLSIVKTSGTNTAVPGTNITYNITVTSNGPSTVTGAMVSDVLPAGTTFVSATNGATYDSGTNTVSFTTGTLATGGTDDFRITLAINLADTGTLSNTATVAPPAGVTDPNNGNNSSTDTVTLTPPADLSIFKTDGNSGSAVPGANVAYTITVTNNGPSTVTGAMVRDVLPASTTFVSATNGATYDSGTNRVSFTTGTLANGDATSFQLTLAISPSATGSLANTATVAPPAGFFDPNLSNNSFTDTIALIPQASPTLLTTASPAITLGTTAPTLSDSAALSGGLNPTGNIVFTLTGPGGFSYTQTDTVSGNATYTASTLLATTGMVAGTYTWTVTYEGDVNNNTAIDQGGPTEQIVVSVASPTLVTTASPAITLGTTAPTLSDSAVLSGGYFPGGSIVFTLTGPGSFSYTQTDTVNGNGTYTASTLLPITGTVAGAYTWSVSYEGDANNHTVTETGSATDGEQTVVSPASPTLITIPTPGILGANPVTLRDTALLEGSFNPSGTITFTLFYNGGSTPVDTETVTVVGDGAYVTPTGFTLPSTGTVTGTYQWNASYSGDSNNNTASDTSAVNERVTVSAARPTLSTIPNPAAVTLDATVPPILTDSASLAGGFNPTGTITFTLFLNGGTTSLDTDVVTVNGNGTYTTPTGFTLPTTGKATGTYQWNATYSGDTNNNSLSDNSDPTERATISPANPTLSTTPSPNTLALGVTLKDTADLEGGFRPAGTITFMLFFNGGSTPVDTETVAVAGNGSYTTPTGFTLPGTGTVTGAYQWNASYSGDSNNNAASDLSNPNELVTITPPSPKITTTPTPATVTLGASSVTLKDTADLTGGLNLTGTITFTLFFNGGSTPVDTESVPVNGDGAYTTPTGFTLPSSGTVTGTYQWDASYSGDSNNNAASDVNNGNEQVTVNAARTMLSTTPTPATVTLGPNSVILTDSATLADGFNPMGTITFTLFYNGGSTPVDTETVPVNGNGIYTTPTGFTLPGTVPVTGTYQWNASYSGDANNNLANDINDINEQVRVGAGRPALGTIPIPDTVTLGTTVVTLNDAAQLVNGFNPTGTITFTLFFNGGSTPVDTVTVTVNGNGIYTTPTGFTLPGAGTVTGAYQWAASYSGDANNNSANDSSDDFPERVTVSAASPTLSTTPIPTTVTLGATPATLTDAATLANGYHPTGAITFTLFYNGGSTPVDTETVTVSGNGSYMTPTGFTLPSTGTATGAYQWDATYSGDPNNNTASDVNNVNERVTVSAASSTLSTTPSPTAVTLGTTTPPILTDNATLAGGFQPTGAITFMLFRNGDSTPVDTETVAVSGNGVYTTPTGFTLPSSGTATGTYQWNASYSGNSNNSSVSDTNAANEQVMVSAASPTLSTTPIPTTVTLGAASPPILTDSATLAGGFHPTGTITFTLFFNGNSTPVDTETVAVNGNGTYTTPTGFSLPGAGAVIGAYQWNTSYSGDANNITASDLNNVNEQVMVSAANPTLSTTPSPATVTLGTSPVTLTDSATLANGFHPTGTITFTLFFNGGSTPVDAETVPVSGNGTYTTPTGFTLPSTIPVTGAYQWDASYSGDSSNNTASDTNAVNEQVTVSAARPTLSTIPTPATVTLGANAVVLTDAATLANGFNPTGTITFTLFFNGGSTPVDTETVAVTGNGSYTTPTGFTLPSTGTVTGTYQWDASYSGDSNNNTASDTNNANEQVTVSAASPTLSTAPSPNTLALGVTLQDTADLEGGFRPAGTITFTLFFNGGSTPVDTETVTVTGNGSYTTPTGFTLPGTGTVTGAYQWNASYSGDSNNNAASDLNNPNEQVTVTPPIPTITTTPTPATVTLGASSVTLKDTADLTGGLNLTGTITFTLFFNGGSTPVDTETVAVSGDGAYTTPTGFTLPSTGTVTGTYQWDASYSGDSNNNAASDLNNPNEQVTVNAARPLLNTAPTPATVTLGANSVILTDAATLADGFNPKGIITFTLFFNGGSTPVDTETVPVTGNGSYTTPTGFTLPGTVPVTGTYQWDASYNGDANNNAASDVNNPNEQVTVNVARPLLSTDPTPATVTLGANSVILTDSATLADGFNPKGTITFTLFFNGGSTPVDTESVAVAGNGSYTTPTGFRLPGTVPVTGTYQWDASYNGDANNNVVSDTNAVNERVTVSAASPTLSTTPNPATVTLGATLVTLTDAATLANGFHPTGAITSTLFYNGGSTPVDTETVAVSGNGAYTTPTGFILPTGGTVTGTYQWNATYSGDPNNTTVSDNNAANEQVTVSPAMPTLSTTPNPTTAPLGATLQDLANLSGGFDPTGSISFRLYAPGVNPTLGPAAYTETVTGVNGNGAYHTIVGFVANATGIWHWVATYNGDSNNKLAPSGPLNEPVAVPEEADLAVAKTVNDSTPVIGQVVTYTVIVHNLGPDAATNVVLQDMLPAGLTLGVATPSQGTYDPATGLWTVGTLPSGVTATLTLEVVVATQSPQTNSITVVHGDQFDPDLSNNTGSATITPVAPPKPPLFPDIMPDFLGKVDLLGSDITAGSPNLMSNVLFVNGLYHDILGRVADQAGLNGWVIALEAGASRSSVAAGFWDSVEHRGIEVDQFYQSLLQRPADPAGRAFWVNDLLAGANEQQVEIALLSSPEYAAKHPGDTLFIEGLYANVLGRVPAPAEVMGWEQALQAGMGRETMVQMFLTSPEWANVEVDALYFQALARPADPLGLSLFTSLLESGAPLQAVAVDLFASAEFFVLPH